MMASKYENPCIYTENKYLKTKKNSNKEISNSNTNNCDD